jgi:hypothetical protein
MNVFVVSAYRWGLRDCHSYVVGVRDTLDAARELADSHVEYRGGKYGCEVVQCDTGAVSAGGAESATSVYYRESPFFGAAGHGGTATPVDPDKPSWTHEGKSKA